MLIAFCVNDHKTPESVRTEPDRLKHNAQPIKINKSMRACKTRCWSGEEGEREKPVTPNNNKT